MIDTTNKKNASPTIYRQYIEGMNIVLENISKESGIKFKSDLYQYVIGCFLNQVLKGNVNHIIDDKKTKILSIDLYNIGIDEACFQEIDSFEFDKFVELKSEISKMKSEKDRLLTEVTDIYNKIDAIENKLLKLPVKSAKILLPSGYYTIELSEFQKYANTDIKSFTMMDNSNVQKLSDFITDLIKQSNETNQHVISCDEDIKDVIQEQKLEVSYRGVGLIIDCRINFDELYE